MITKFFNGKYFFENLFKNICNEIFFYKYFSYKSLCFSIFIVGNIFSANLYVKNKIYSCYLSSIDFLIFKFSNDVKMKTLLMVLKIVKFDILINGIIIQLPLVCRLNKPVLFNSICVYKDIDLLNSFNFGHYYLSYSKNIIPSTVKSVLFLLKKFKINCVGLRCVVFGFSNIVGKPLSLELNSLGMTVVIVSKNDLYFYDILKSSDIVISAVGILNFLKIKNVSKGSLVIDIGINESNYDIVLGDFCVEFSSNFINLITPVPGGIGPLTVYHILDNFVKINVNKNFVAMV
ncbi:bifunctional 5,10-methylenetetrahydrofolate dehydrogenase/5,10-methenyltetrahydrofolate cyclohydrolase [Candidatus Azoamicus ciliaticola]|uniref:Bifunctional protein FolD protein n=1 Tax=Candidatus Azoamicus ciliaticola TaxID=2652803 RepID=A0A6J5JXY5_9GAMM|nr:bifunctional 5,10-methylenetetrahydrofolate dehydrogenase/5,10-methenyltetrahydrofolate cyclohydrolase [Candidatus Azoamicus ciliaticola]CAB3976382.1 Bifunctional protein FolD protein [Candidatus Azoamicus ciliaticola]